MQDGISRRNFLKLGATGAAGFALSQSVFAGAAEAQEARQLITPQEFVDRLNQARGVSAEAYYDVQRNFRIFNAEPIRLNIRINAGLDSERTITPEFDPDLLFRETGATIGQISNSPSSAFVDTAPTVAFMGSLHTALYRLDPNDPNAPTREDLSNFEWRTRTRAAEENLRTAVTWDERLRHIVTYHHVLPDDINQAFTQARVAIRNLLPDGRSAQLDLGNEANDFARLDSAAPSLTRA